MLPLADQAVATPRCELAHIFREYGQSYRHNHSLPLSHRRVMRAIEHCRTSALNPHSSPISILPPSPSLTQWRLIAKPPLLQRLLSKKGVFWRGYSQAILTQNWTEQLFYSIRGLTFSISSGAKSRQLHAVVRPLHIYARLISCHSSTAMF